MVKRRERALQAISVNHAGDMVEIEIKTRLKHYRRQEVVLQKFYEQKVKKVGS